jgi:cell division protein FtsN
MLSEPETIPFSVKGGEEGDIIYDLNFTVTYLPDDTSADKAVVPEIRKDTTYMIIHEVVQELVTISEDSWAIQLGAFRNKSNAEAYRRKLHKLLGKDVEIVVEDGYYKVRILDLKTREEVDRNIELLRQNGVTELWVIRLKAKQQQLVLTEKVDSIATITETITGTAAPIISTDMVLQAGAFRDENNAVRLRDKLSATINKPVVIVPEEGYYKVRVTGFETLEEIEKMIAALGFLGHRDIWIPSFRDTAAVAAPGLTIPPDTITEAVTEIPEIPVDEKEISEAEPTVALQVGVFQKKRHAVRAQRK